MIRIIFTGVPAWHPIILLVAVIGYGSVNAQLLSPLIRATSSSVDIKDGTIFQKNVWSLSPEINPDIYYALNPEAPHTVTFYTDRDSISFDVNPGGTYDFIVVLNDTDTCHTQIKSITREAIRVERISPSDLQQDFMFLKQALLREHAGLYRYLSKIRFTEISDSLFQILNRPMNQFEFGVLIRFYLSAIKDGHTGTSFPGELMEHYTKHVRMFPFQPHFIGNRAYVRCDEFPDLPPGTEVLTIDGVLVNDIRKTLFRYLSGDGAIESKKYWILNRDAFPFLYSWVYGEDNEYMITYKSRAGQLETISLEADYLKEACALITTQNSNDKHLRLEYTRQNTAVMTIGTFSSDRLRQTNEDFKQILDSSFREIDTRGIDTLIIDLRNNSGGDDHYGALLYAYLTDEPFRYFTSIASTSKEFTIADHPGLGEQQPAATNFKGYVIFLINGLCFSTTSDFCAIAKSNNRGIFIGEETGGAYYGNTSGETLRMALPNSNVNISIPKNKYVNAVKNARYSDRGVIPDYVIIPGIDDVIAGRDVQLEFAINFANLR